jgi:hypothetical protein
MRRMPSAVLIMALAACSVTEQAKTDTMQSVRSVEWGHRL